jgi:hypothetical protein
MEGTQGWALIGRDGKKLGYVPDAAVDPIQ